MKTEKSGPRVKFIGIEERRKNKTSFAIATPVVWAPLPIKKVMNPLF